MMCFKILPILLLEILFPLIIGKDFNFKDDQRIDEINRKFIPLALNTLFGNDIVKSRIYFHSLAKSFGEENPDMPNGGSVDESEAITPTIEISSNLTSSTNAVNIETEISVAYTSEPNSTVTESMATIPEPSTTVAGTTTIIFESNTTVTESMTTILESTTTITELNTTITETSLTSQTTVSSLNNEFTEIEYLNDTFYDFFTEKRSEEYNSTLKHETRAKILQKFQELGLLVIEQAFTVKTNLFLSSVTYNGVNLIGVVPGKNYGSTNDSIIVVASHYDTVKTCPGVDDNGAGSVAVLEIARLLTHHGDKLEATIYFVMFDLEEKGLLGSSAFVNDFMVPKVLAKCNCKFIGAYVFDMLLTYDPRPDAQRVPYDIKLNLPEFNDKVEANKNKGDFMAIWMRRDVDNELWLALKKAWYLNNTSPFLLYEMDPPLPESDPNLIEKTRYGTFFRSDHASFWYHKADYKSLNAVLMSDLGPWRGYQRKCYHAECDNTSQLTKINLEFLKKAVDTAKMAIINLSEIN